MTEPVELNERYKMVHLPSGYALQCSLCAALIIDATLHDEWHDK